MAIKLVHTTTLANYTPLTTKTDLLPTYDPATLLLGVDLIEMCACAHQINT